MNLILASQSPMRKEYLERFGIPFTIQPAHVDESVLKNETPLAYIKRIAMAKAQAISQANPGSVVVAADTPVILGRRILQTPQTEAEAETMLRIQSGRRVAVHTVVAVADAAGNIHTKTASSWFKMKRLTDAEISGYIKAGLWQNTAGGIKFLHMEHWVQTFHGSFAGARGLPLYETATLLARAGLRIQPFKGAGA